MDKFIAELKDCVREVKERPGSDKTEGDMVTIYGLSPLSYLSSGVVILLNDFFATSPPCSLLNLPRGAPNDMVPKI